MNESGLPVVAADIPSGVDGATGQVLGDAVHARETVTFHRAKHGLLLYPGRAYAGKLTVADIGILPEWDGAQGIDVLEETDACALLPVRPGDGHKGTFGHVLSAAGSEGMAGAATLCARSALRAGAGLVTAACPFAVLNTVQAQAPCAMAKVVADGASLDAGAADMLKELAEHKAALAVGPGLGREEGAWLAIEALVKSDIPKVIDADALFLLAKHGGSVGANTVLTPHPGEMARLCGMTTQAVLAAPVETAQQLFDRWQRLNNYLLVKYMDGNVKSEHGDVLTFLDGDGSAAHFVDNGNGKQIPGKIQFPGYNEKWKRAVAKDNGEILKVVK